MPESKKTNLIYLLVQSFLCCAHGCYFGFLVVYLTQNGYDSVTIGFIMTLLAVFGLIITPLWGYLSDFVIPVKRIICGCMLLSIPAAFLLRFSTGMIPLTVVSILCMCVLERHMTSVVDSWGMKVMAKKPYLDYGLARGTAAFIYAVSGLLLGQVFSKFGIHTLFYLHAVLAGCCVISACFFDSVPTAPRSEKKQPYGQTAKKLLQNRRYRILLVCLMLAGVASVSSATFHPLRITQLGGTTAAMGASMFVMASSEMPAMFISKRLLSRFRADILLTVALFGIVLRMLANALAPNLPVLIAVQCLQALSYGLFLPVLLEYIRQITEPEMTATAITLGIACFDGFFGVIGNLVGGVLAATIGVRMVLLLFAGIAFVSFLIFLGGLLREKNSNGGQLVRD